MQWPPSAAGLRPACEAVPLVKEETSVEVLGTGVSRALWWVRPRSLGDCDSMASSLPSSSVHGIHQAKILAWVAISYARGIFLTQGLNLRLLHCRQILYQLRHEGSRMDLVGELTTKA